MDFKFSNQNVINDILNNNNNDLIKTNLNMILDIFKAAQDFTVLSKIQYLDLRKYSRKKDSFSVKILNPSMRLTIKKLDKESILILTIITK